MSKIMNTSKYLPCCEFRLLVISVFHHWAKPIDVLGKTQSLFFPLFLIAEEYLDFSESVFSGKRVGSDGFEKCFSLWIVAGP